MFNLNKTKNDINLLKKTESENKILVNLLDQRTNFINSIPLKPNLSKQIRNDNLFKNDVQRIIFYLNNHKYNNASKLINNMPTKRCSLEVLLDNKVYQKLLKSYKENIALQYNIYNKIEKNSNNL
tara:strand:+ start:119 stop:493 length:375 start_codon:yes stop_codon:yes gene_type:complete